MLGEQSRHKSKFPLQRWMILIAISNHLYGGQEGDSTVIINALIWIVINALIWTEPGFRIGDTWKVCRTLSTGLNTIWHWNEHTQYLVWVCFSGGGTVISLCLIFIFSPGMNVTVWLSRLESIFIRVVSAIYTLLQLGSGVAKISPEFRNTTEWIGISFRRLGFYYAVNWVFKVKHKP